MSKHRYVKSDFWDDDYVVSLSRDEKLFFLYLVTNEKTNILGVYGTTIRKIEFDTTFTEEEINQYLEKFAKDDKVYFICGHVLMVNFLKHQKPNGTMIKGIQKLYNDLPDKIIDFILSKKSKIYYRLSKHIDTVRYHYKDKDINKDKDKNNNAEENADVVPELEDKRFKILKGVKSGLIDISQYLLEFPENDLRKDAEEVIMKMRVAKNPNSKLPPQTDEIEKLIQNWIFKDDQHSVSKEELLKMINGAVKKDFEKNNLTVKYLLNPEHKAKLLMLYEDKNYVDQSNKKSSCIYQQSEEFK